MAFIDLPGNLVLVHGTGTTGCHGYIESHREEAAARGFNVQQSTDPQRLPAFYPIQINVYGVRRWELRDDDYNRFVIEASEAIRILTEYGVDIEALR